MNTLAVPKFNLQHLLIGVFMLLAAGLAFVLTPKAKLADQGPRVDLESLIPKQFGDWRVDESIVPLQVSPDVQANLEMTYDQIVSRTYVNSRGERIMLSITYGSRQNREHRSHRQEVCYSAQGFKISELQHVTLPIRDSKIPATRMLATQGRRFEPVTYWFTMGDHVVLSKFERQWIQLKYALSGVIPDGYMVRISNLSNNTEHSFNLHIEFAEELIGALDPALTGRLLGRNTKGEK